MVKKKAPFIPVTIIVLGAGFVFAMNARSRPVDPEEEAHRQQAKAAEGERPKDNPDVVTKKLMPAPKSPTVAAKNKYDGSVPIQAPAGSGPSPDPMLTNKPGHYKPTYNPTTAEQQWYHSK